MEIIKLNYDNKNELYRIILDVLSTFEHTQFNIDSECARQIMSQDIHDAVHVHISEIVEDIVCPSSS